MHFGTQLRAVQAFLQQFLNPMQRPGWTAFLQPLRIRGWAIEFFIRRITSRSKARERLRLRDQGSGFDPAVNLPRPETLVR
jgi:hypothetical protein